MCVFRLHRAYSDNLVNPPPDSSPDGFRARRRSSHKGCGRGQVFCRNISGISLIKNGQHLLSIDAIKMDVIGCGVALVYNCTYSEFSLH